MTVPIRVRINLESREFEVEGPETFVNIFVPKINEFLDSFASKATEAGSRTRDENASPTAKVKTPKSADIPETFGEYFFDLPKDAFGTDQILVAGHFAQLSSDENSFSTQDASTLLLDQGVKLGNPSDAIAKNLRAKTIIKLGKGRFRVSPDGVDHIAELRSKKLNK